ncbi:right-handed parallel beta-helix repeat-containing protein, partial [Escherichia coli]|uniref:right-handed parallel beta-helix repeat-containing protein n=1 Tax=Escherichia coli TaxID=562 RepID=UPI003C6D17B5
VYGCSNSRIMICYVHNVEYIGIQCERPNGMTITGCAVASCGDNGIDIFGNVTDESGQGVAEDVVVSNNTIRDVSVGVFIESCGNVAISSCRISG